MFSNPLWFENINGKADNEDNETHEAFGAINIENIELNKECSISSVENDKCSQVANFIISLSCFENPFLQVHSKPLLKKINFDLYLNYGISNGDAKLFGKSNYGMFACYSYDFGLANDLSCSKSK